MRHRAQLLVSQAEAQGLVLTIEQIPLQPLAAGHYRTEVSVYQCHAQWEGSGMKSEYRLGATCNGKQKTTAGVVLGYKID